MIIAVFDTSVAFFHGKVRKVNLRGASEGPSKEGEDLEIAQEALWKL